MRKEGGKIVRKKEDGKLREQRGWENSEDGRTITTVRKGEQS